MFVYIIPMNDEIIKRMDEVIALKRRIKALGLTIGKVCHKCKVGRSTFSHWGAGRVRSAKWDLVCSYVKGCEIIKEDQKRLDAEKPSAPPA